MAAEPWITLVQTFGVAVVCLGALGYAVWRVLVWTGTHVVLPVLQRHIAFLDTMSGAVDTMSSAVEKLVITLDRMAEKFDGVAEDVVAVKSIVVRGDRVEVLAQTAQRGGGSGSGTHPGS